MSRGSGRRVEQAVLLADDPIGVDRETTPRYIQFNGNSFTTTIDPSWLRQLNIQDKGEPVYHSLSLGSTAVIVQKPAIIIQPARVIEEGLHD